VILPTANSDLTLNNRLDKSAIIKHTIKTKSCHCELSYNISIEYPQNRTCFYNPFPATHAIIRIETETASPLQHHSLARYAVKIKFCNIPTFQANSLQFLSWRLQIKQIHNEEMKQLIPDSSVVWSCS